jgi:N-acetylglucosaminyl-diphospho-decaprenol L-rhamnosyltransferase
LWRRRDNNEMTSLLMVNYRSASLAIEAIRSARLATSKALQVVVVDNSCDPREAEALRPHADVVIESISNRGYAGGINDGRRACDGESIVIANPDVLFAPASIDLLVDSDAAVAGPALFWDDAHRWLLPPSDLHSGWEKVDEVLATRSRKWFEQRDRRRFLRRVAFWSLTKPTQVRALSGAVLAIRTDAPQFDERFPLYFEETDFLRRVQGRVMYVPAARVRHLYNQSAGQVSAEAAQRYATSELRYLEKWNGPFVAQLLKRLERPSFAFELSDGPIEGDVVIEASPLPSFATASGNLECGGHAAALDPREERRHGRRTPDLPTEVLASWRGGPIYLRAVERETGRVLRVWLR